MKPCLVIVFGIILCLLILFIVFYSNQNVSIIKIQKQQLITMKQDATMNIEKQQLITVKQNDRLIEWNKMIPKYLRFPLENGYGSHAIVLLAALHVTKSGPILELGMGPTSSPLLHRLALEQNRFLLSADSDLKWIEYFSSFTKNNTLHELRYVEIKTEMGVEWAKSNITDYKPWSIVFIDHRPGPRRQFDLMAYAHRSDIVILHDTEHSGLYHYSRGLSLYPFQYRFTRLQTFTDILSRKNETLVNRARYLLESTSNDYFINITITK